MSRSPSQIWAKGKGKGGEGWLRCKVPADTPVAATAAVTQVVDHSKWRCFIKVRRVNHAPALYCALRRVMEREGAGRVAQARGGEEGSVFGMAEEDQIIRGQEMVTFLRCDIMQKRAWSRT